MLLRSRERAQGRPGLGQFNRGRYRGKLRELAGGRPLLVYRVRRKSFRFVSRRRRFSRIPRVSPRHGPSHISSYRCARWATISSIRVHGLSDSLLAVLRTAGKDTGAGLLKSKHEVVWPKGTLVRIISQRYTQCACRRDLLDSPAGGIGGIFPPGVERCSSFDAERAPARTTTDRA